MNIEIRSFSSYGIYPLIHTGKYKNKYTRITCLSFFFLYIFKFLVYNIVVDLLRYVDSYPHLTTTFLYLRKYTE